MFVRRDLTDTVPTREGNMHFVKQGAGYPLVMLHPLGTSTWAWSSVIDAFSQHYTCYAFDMLGHGESDKPTRHFNIPDYAQALDDACQILNIHRGHYVGNSVGAVLATEMAASFPERLDKLVLVGAPVWDARTAPERIAESAAGYDADGMPVPRTMEQAKESTTFAEQPERRKVHLAGDVLLPHVPVRVAADPVPVVANQRALRVLRRVEVGGQLAVVDGEDKPALQARGNLVNPVLHRQIHLAPIAFGQGQPQGGQPLLDAGR